MELCIFDGSKIFQKDEFLHGKMHILYFVDFIEIAACILQKGENMHFPMEKCKFLENLGAIKNA